MNNILRPSSSDPDTLRMDFDFRDCNRFGECNPCDVKLKNNRFQQFGTCSVTIKS